MIYLDSWYTVMNTTSIRRLPKKKKARIKKALGVYHDHDDVDITNGSFQTLILYNTHQKKRLEYSHVTFYVQFAY